MTGDVISMTVTEFAEFIKDEIELSHSRNCTTCDHWVIKAEQCRLAGFRRPPAKIIVRGCEKWVNEEIPF